MQEYDAKEKSSIIFVCVSDVFNLGSCAFCGYLLNWVFIFSYGYEKL